MLVVSSVNVDIKRQVGPGSQKGKDGEHQIPGYHEDQRWESRVLNPPKGNDKAHSDPS